MKATAESVRVIQGVTLKMDVAEAQWLMDLMQAVGGSPTTSRRGHATSTIAALRNVGIVPRPGFGETGDMSGSISFADVPLD